MNPTSEGHRHPAPQELDPLVATLRAEAAYFRPFNKSDDPLPAELRAAQVLAQYAGPGGVGAATFMRALLELAERHREQDVAGLAAAVGSLVPGQITVQVVTDLVRGGLLMPRWYRRLGVARPARAWRYRDVFGDQEVALITFRYGESEHGIVVETVHCPAPRVLAVQATTDPERTRAALAASRDAIGAPRELVEISLEEARDAVSMAIRKPHRDAEPGDLVLLPVVRNRVSRLPETPPPWAHAGHDHAGHDHAGHDHAGHDHAGHDQADRAGNGHGGTTGADPGNHDGQVSPDTRPSGVWWVTPDRPTREQRKAAVEEFLAEIDLPAGLDAEVLRFWAEALVGYTGLTGASPLRIGPAWLEAALADHVPAVFELTPPQRAGLLPAVTAWAGWAAGRQGMPAAAVALLRRHLVQLDAMFDTVSADPGLPAFRCYLSDVARETADGEDLLRVQRLRTLAVPPPYRRPERTRALLASDPVHRRLIHAERERDVHAGAGVPDEPWLDAVALVSDRLWNDEPAGLAEAVATQLDLLERLDKHEHVIDFESPEPSPALLDRLAELALEHPDDPEGFLAAVRTRDWAGARNQSPLR
jgi:hypothetical protein